MEKFILEMLNELDKENFDVMSPFHKVVLMKKDSR